MRVTSIVAAFGLAVASCGGSATRAVAERVVGAGGAGGVAGAGGAHALGVAGNDLADGGEGGSQAGSSSSAGAAGASIADPFCGDTSGLQPGSPWPMFARCPTLAGRTLAHGPRHGAILWSLTDESRYCGSPVVDASGMIYVGSADTSVRAVTPDGSVAWSADVPGPLPSAFALARDGTLYVRSFSAVSALSPGGTMLWSLPQLSGCSAPVVGASGEIFVTCSQEPTASSLVAVSPEGDIDWSVPFPGAVSAPSLAEDGTLYVASDKVSAVSSSGELLWTRGPPGTYQLDVSSVIVVPDGLVFLANAGTVHELTRDGFEIWSATGDFPGGGGFWAPPATASDGSLRVSLEESPTSRLGSIANGAVSWTAIFPPFRQAATVSPIVDGADVAYVWTANDGNGSEVLAVDPSGTILWTLDVPGAPSIGGAMGADGTIYFAGDCDGDARLVAVGDASP